MDDACRTGTSSEVFTVSYAERLFAVCAFNKVDMLATRRNQWEPCAERRRYVDLVLSYVCVCVRECVFRVRQSGLMIWPSCGAIFRRLRAILLRISVDVLREVAGAALVPPFSADWLLGTVAQLAR